MLRTEMHYVWTVLLCTDIPRTSVHAQARLFPPRHEAGEPPVLRSRTGEDRRFRIGSGNPVASSVHRLRVHPVVPGTWGPTTFHQLQHTHRLVGRRLHHGGAVHVQAVVPRHQRDRPNIQNMLGFRDARQGECGLSQLNT